MSNRRRFAHLYGSGRWRSLSEDFLACHPRCARCGKPSEHTDHIDATFNSADEFWAGPFQALCHSCHMRKTARFDRPSLGYSTSARRDGRPIDPRHPWNTGDYTGD